MCQPACQLPTGFDPELAEHVAQVPLDGATAEEQPRPDLGVREAITGKLGDLPLLRRQIVARLGGPLADSLPRRQQLVPSAFGEAFNSYRGELVVRDAELGPRVYPAVHSSKSLAVKQSRAGELGSYSRSRQMVDRFNEMPLGTRVFAQEGS